MPNVCDYIGFKATGTLTHAELELSENCRAGDGARKGGGRLAKKKAIPCGRTFNEFKLILVNATKQPSQ
jgi:hypothetical protein